jgi:hypothetical protein
MQAQQSPYGQYQQSPYGQASQMGQMGQIGQMGQMGQQSSYGGQQVPLNQYGQSQQALMGGQGTLQANSALYGQNQQALYGQAQGQGISQYFNNPSMQNPASFGGYAGGTAPGTPGG